MHARKWALFRVRYRAMSDKPTPTGPKGGKTTHTPGGFLKKTIYFDSEEWEALRKKGYEEHRAISDLIRELIRRGLDLDKD
jgi:hypothetical protein